MTEYYSDIIIGAGSTGCVIAARISEDPRRQVLLIEAGPDYLNEHALPPTLRNGLVPDLATHDWGLMISGNYLKSIHAPRGRVVGGCSAINACIALRAEPADFEDWSKGSGAGWGWESILDSYIKVENDLDFGGRYHGQHGPVVIKRWTSEEIVPVSQSFLSVCAEHGFIAVPDLNQPDTSGIGVLPMNLANGVRQSAALCFINPIRNRSNLTVLSGATVDKLTFSGACAKGVIITNQNAVTEIQGERIIVSAGTYGTAAILLRSGIGSERDLRRYGIEPVLNLPGVGRNLMDHPQCYIAVSAVPGTSNPTMPCAQVLLRFTSSGSKYVNDMQLSLLNWVDIKKFAPEIVAEVGNNNVFMIMVQLEHPRARGKVSLHNCNPNELPLIELDYCAAEEDLQRLREGVRLGWEMLNSQPLRRYVNSVIDLKPEDINDDERLNRYIRTHVLTSHHPMGTAQMGLVDNSEAVVDHECRVIGAEQLWVCDASIIPVPLRANTNLTCLAIGDRVGRLLLEDA